MRLSLLFVVPLATGCVRTTAGALIPANRPLTGPYELKRPVDREACETYLFGGIPVSRGIRIRDLVDEIKGDADAVVDLTIDHRLRDYFVVAMRCYVVTGTPVRVVEAPKVAAAALPSPKPAPAPAPEPAAWTPDDRRRVSTLSASSRKPVDAPPGVSGTCLVEVWTNPAGEPEQVVPDPERCDERAAEAVVDSVMRWTFEAVELDGEAVPVHFPLKVPLE